MLHQVQGDLFPTDPVHISRWESGWWNRRFFREFFRLPKHRPSGLKLCWCHQVWSHPPLQNRTCSMDFDFWISVTVLVVWWWHRGGSECSTLPIQVENLLETSHQSESIKSRKKRLWVGLRSADPPKHVSALMDWMWGNFKFGKKYFIFIFCHVGPKLQQIWFSTHAISKNVYPTFLSIVLAQHIGDIAIVSVWWQPLLQPLQGLLTALLDLEATPSIKRMNFL